MDMIRLAVVRALQEALDMFWEVLWPLVLDVGLASRLKAPE
jgi:hypothetical protein